MECSLGLNKLNPMSMFWDFYSLRNCHVLKVDHGCSLWLHSLSTFIFFLAKVITAHSWGNESDPDTDLILQSRPWHLNRPPGKEPINKEDKRGKSCEGCSLLWIGFKSSAGTTENATWSVASDLCSPCLLVWHVMPCQKSFNNHGHSFISVLHI